jgi:preprotein translocase subunit SecG
MTTLFTLLIIIVSVLLMLVVLVQNPKGGGLSSAFGGDGGNMLAGGVRRTNDFLEKSTWTLALALLALVLLVNITNPSVDRRFYP